jgi:hypothetical protein
VTHLLHRWVAFKVEEMAVVRIGDDDQEITRRPLTYIYQRCSCGRTRMVRRDGRWSLEELR